MLNAFSRDIRSIRAQENIGVHSGAPLLVEHFPQKSDPYLYGPIVAVRLRANLEAHSWTNEPHCVSTVDPKMKWCSARFVDRYIDGRSSDIGSWAQPTTRRDAPSPNHGATFEPRENPCLISGDSLMARKERKYKNGRNATARHWDLVTEGLFS